MDCVCVFYDKNNAKLHVVKPNGKSITRLKEVSGEEAEELYELLTDQTVDTWIPLTTRQMTSEEREYYKLQRRHLLFRLQRYGKCSSVETYAGSLSERRVNATRDRRTVN